MTTIDTTNSTTSTSTASSASKAVSSLDIDDFITLMTTQLQNQDPTNPTDATEYVSQLAQFATVSGVQEINDSMSDLSDSLRSSQALSGAALIGRDVLVPAESTTVASGGSVSGAIDAPSGTSKVQIQVTNSAGEVVRTLSLDSAGSGLNSFTWDGLTDDGAQAAAGTYEFDAVATVNGSSEGVDTLLASSVSSVTIDSSSNTLSLNTASLGSVALSAVRAIL